MKRKDKSKIQKIWLVLWRKVTLVLARYLPYTNTLAHIRKKQNLRTELKYIELKSGFSDNGSAWIGLVSFSKSGKTIYFNGKGFQSLNGQGISGNYFDLENGNEYWISGIKKDMTDRHKFGGGKILVEKRILKEYLQIIGKSELPKTGYELTEIDIKKPVKKIHELENTNLKNL